MINIPNYISSKRAGYAKLPAVLRAFIVALAFIAGLVGVGLLFTPPPIFDIAVILVLLSLSILSFQFQWAHAVLLYITKKLAQKAFRKKLLLFGTFMFIVLVVAIVQQ